MLFEKIEVLEQFKYPSGKRSIKVVALRDGLGPGIKTMESHTHGVVVDSEKDGKLVIPWANITAAAILEPITEPEEAPKPKPKSKPSRSRRK